MSAADLDWQERSGTLVATVNGDIDMANGDALQAALAARMENSAMGAVLDLSRVDYIDSTGIHVLFRLARRLEQRGQRLRVVVPPESPVADALRYADALEAMDASPTLEAALEDAA